MIEDEITVVIFTGNTYCEGRGRIEKLYLTNRDGYTLRVGFIDTDVDADTVADTEAVTVADAAGSAGFIDIDESVCLYVVVAVAVLSTCLGVLDAEGSVCLGVLDAEDVPVAVPVLVCVLDVVAVSDVVAVTSACLGVLDANVCFGEAVEDSLGLLKVGIAFGDALTVLVIEY